MIITPYIVTPVTVLEALPYMGRSLVEQCLAEAHAGDAQLFHELYHQCLIYDHAEKAWYLWGGHAWCRDSTQQVRRLVTGQLAAQYLQLAAELAPAAAQDAQSKAIQAAAIKRAHELRTLYRIKSVLELAQGLLGIDGHEWDQQSWKLAVSNGVEDLRTAQLVPGDPAEYVRMVAPTTWTGTEAPAPRWNQFLNEIFDGDAAMVQFVLRIVGAALSGTAQEHILPVLWGEEGRNGKDTLLKVLSAVLGPYVGAVSSDVLIDQKHGRSAGSATPHLMRLRGKRLAWVSETSAGARLNVAQVKHLTGGGEIPARDLHEREITFRPTHILLLLTNRRPHIPADDDPMWDRLKLIPFTQRFVDEPTRPNEHKRDTRLVDALHCEASGILASLVRGCLDWQTNGLGTPERVKQATSEYRDDEDILAQFVAQRCVKDKDARVGARKLYNEYRQWAEDTGTYPIMKETAFGRWMGRHYVRKEERSGNVYLGIGLLASDGIATPDLSQSGSLKNGGGSQVPTIKSPVSDQSAENIHRNGHEVEGVEGSAVFPALHEESQAKKPDTPLHTPHTANEGMPFSASHSSAEGSGQSDGDPTEDHIPDEDWGSDDDYAHLVRDLANAGYVEGALWMADEIQNAAYRRDVKRDIELRHTGSARIK